MLPLPRHDRNIWGLIDGRTIDTKEVPAPYRERHFSRAAQMHSSLVGRLSLDTVMEGHTGCVNTIAWNKSGSLLCSGSDDQHVRIWNYATRELVHSIETGHTANIFCAKFMPETGDEVVVSGAGDGEVRVHRMSRALRGRQGDGPSPTQPVVSRCHTPKRVKKLAVQEGSPHMVWSAGEDGTLRQHDLREHNACSSSADHECRNVLLDLRGAAKRSLSDAPGQCLALKSCALSPTNPHHLLVGGNDAFGRLFDRRMLATPGAAAWSPHPAKPPPCVCYYAPAHLAETARPWLHLTHVTFSPDGREVLLSYSGEHVYLMDAFSGRDDTVVYRAEDVHRRNLLPPLPLPAGRSPGKPLPRAGVLACQMAGWRTARRPRDFVHECEELLGEARREVRVGSVASLTRAVESCGEVLEAEHTAGLVGPGLRYEGLCVRAAALVKRGWKNDCQLAIRDCNAARALEPASVAAHHHMAEALAQAGQERQALEFAQRAEALNPGNPELRAHVSSLRDKIAQEGRGSNGSTRSGHGHGHGRGHSPSSPGGPRSITIEDLLRGRSGYQVAHGPEEEEEEEEEGGSGEDEDEDAHEEEDEMQREASASSSSPGREDRGREGGGGAGEGEHWAEGRGRRGHRGEREGAGGDHSRDGQAEGDSGARGRRRAEGAEGSGWAASARGMAAREGTGSQTPMADVAVDMRQRYLGHCNTGTDIKQASFLGERGDYIASGSDDGRWFIWEKCTGRLVKMLLGDENVVNCIQCHPFDCSIATSGIDESIKLWTPRAEVASAVAGGAAGPDTADSVGVRARNQANMMRPRSSLPIEFFTRLRVGEEGHHIQCHQS